MIEGGGEHGHTVSGEGGEGAHMGEGGGQHRFQACTVERGGRGNAWALGMHGQWRGKGGYAHGRGREHERGRGRVQALGVCRQ